jgi:hypothetical protein
LLTNNNCHNILYESLYFLQNRLQANPPQNGSNRPELAHPLEIINLDNKSRFDYPVLSSDRNFRAPDIRRKTSQEAMISREPIIIVEKLRN